MKTLRMIFSAKKRFEDDLIVQCKKNEWTLKYTPCAFSSYNSKDKVYFLKMNKNAREVKL